MQSPNSDFSPVKAEERILVLDALRGFALLGVILINLWSFSGYSWLSPDQKQELPTYWIDQWVDILLSVLINTKFITLFSILFGVGFAIQLDRAKAKGIAFKAYFLKRMLLLLLIGCFHAYLFWFGDILRHYALSGIMLLFVIHWSDKWILWLGLFFAVILTALLFILNGLLFSASSPPVGELSLPQQILQVFGTGNYFEVLKLNWIIDPFNNFLKDAPITFAATIGKFLLGYWMGRIGLFVQPQRFQSLLSKWLWWGISFGVLGSVAFWALNNGHLELNSPWLLWMPFAIAAALVLHSLFYLSFFVYLFNTIKGRSLLQIFIPVGKMALTNYFVQSLIGLFLFYGFLPGFHWFGKVGAFYLLLLGLLIFTFQIIWSTWWLKINQQGPIEWLWRKMAYNNLN